MGGGLRPAVDCGRLRMMMTNINVVMSLSSLHPLIAKYILDVIWHTGRAYSGLIYKKLSRSDDLV